MCFLLDITESLFSLDLSICLFIFSQAASTSTELQWPNITELDLFTFPLFDHPQDEAETYFTFSYNQNHMEEIHFLGPL